jgi:hypothetical protein
MLMDQFAHSAFLIRIVAMNENEKFYGMCLPSIKASQVQHPWSQHVPNENRIKPDNAALAAE